MYCAVTVFNPFAIKGYLRLPLVKSPVSQFINLESSLSNVKEVSAEPLEVECP